MMMTEKQGLWNDSYGQIGATLKALQDVGVTPSHLALIRSDKVVAQAVADVLLEQTEADRRLSSILKPDQYFGPTDWIRHFGVKELQDVRLPVTLSCLKKVLESPCPFILGKLVKETHYLYYLPLEFRGAPLTIMRWWELFPYEGEPCFYTDTWYKDEDFATIDTARLQWFLMFKGVMPGSESHTREEQLLLKPDKYTVPKAVECVPMHFLSFIKNGGQRINSNIFGRTQDIYQGNHVFVGLFENTGLCIFNYVASSDRNSSVGQFLFRRL